MPLALEAGGRPSREFQNFVRRCSSAMATDTDGVSACCNRLWYEVSCQLQLDNAELILSAVGK